MQKQLRMTVLGLVMMLALAVYVVADCRVRIPLAATPEGAAINARGTAEVRQEKVRERFRVQVEANVVDGTTFTVFADDQLAGTLTTTFGRGELQLEAEDGSLPDELRPVCNISTVDVVDDSGTLILHGEF